MSTNSHTVSGFNHSESFVDLPNLVLTEKGILNRATISFTDPTVVNSATANVNGILNTVTFTDQPNSPGENYTANVSGIGNTVDISGWVTNTTVNLHGAIATRINMDSSAGIDVAVTGVNASTRIDISALGYPSVADAVAAGSFGANGGAIPAFQPSLGLGDPYRPDYLVVTGHVTAANFVQ